MTSAVGMPASRPQEHAHSEGAHVACALRPCWRRQACSGQPKTPVASAASTPTADASCWRERSRPSTRTLETAIASSRACGGSTRGNMAKVRAACVSKPPVIPAPCLCCSPFKRADAGENCGAHAQQFFSAGKKLNRCRRLRWVLKALVSNSVSIELASIL